jgi:hypothetical protein
MARVFDITAASDTVRLDGNGQGDIAFTASNVSGRPLRGRANLVPQDAASKAWLSVSGGPERDFPGGGTQQFSVKVAVPPGTKAGKYNFRLDVVSVQNPDEDYTQGPNVAVSVTLAPPPPWHFPWWILVVAAVILIGLGGVAWYLLTPSTVEVPQIVGLTPAAATKALSDSQLKGEQQGEEHTGIVNPGLVSSQTPAPTSASNVKAASNSIVKFKIEGTGPVPRKPVPDVTSSHMLLDPAIHAILDAGFTVDQPSGRITPFNLLAGKVVDQSLTGTAPVGSTVHLTVGMIRLIDWQTMVSSETLERVKRVNKFIVRPVPR